MGWSVFFTEKKRPKVVNLIIPIQSKRKRFFPTEITIESFDLMGQISS